MAAAAFKSVWIFRGLKSGKVWSVSAAHDDVNTNSVTFGPLAASSYTLNEDALLLDCIVR